MQCGYVKLWRSVIDCGLMQRPNEFTMFCYLLMQAAREPFRYGTRSGVVDIPVGGYISTLDRLSADLRLSKQEVRTSIKNLEKMEILTCRTTNKYTMYVIDNYEKYQSSNTEANTQINTQSTRNQHAINTQSTQEQELKNLRTRELENKEEFISSAEPPPPQPKKSSKGSRLPADWFLPKSWGEWVKTERPDLSVDDIKKQADCFRDYWVAVAGAKGVKADWEATWRNWIRRVDAGSKQAKSHGDLSNKNYGIGVTDL